MMKFFKNQTYLLYIFLALGTAGSVQGQNPEVGKYILEQDTQVAKAQPGPHSGGGQSIGYSFFESEKDLYTAFKKRTLKPGSAIGYHLQHEDEIYYILSGTGQMQMNGKIFPVKPGDAILTRPGSSHGLTPDKDQELTLIIVYRSK